MKVTTLGFRVKKPSSGACTLLCHTNYILACCATFLIFIYHISVFHFYFFAFKQFDFWFFQFFLQSVMQSWLDLWSNQWSCPWSLQWSNPDYISKHVSAKWCIQLYSLLNLEMMLRSFFDGIPIIALYFNSTSRKVTWKYLARECILQLVVVLASNQPLFIALKGI